MDSAVLYPILISLSIACQIAAVIAALRMLPLFGRSWGWAVVAGAFAMMAVRRGYTLTLYLSSDVAPPPSLGPEITALFTSVLLFAGVALLAARFELWNRSERKLRESQERYERIVENVHEGIWLTDSTGATVFTNAAVLQMLGYSGDDLLSKSIDEFIEWPADETDSESDAPETGFRTKSGEIFWVALGESEFSVDDNPEPGRLYVLRDANEKRENAKRLLEREQYYRSLTERSTDIVMILDEANVIQYVTPALTMEFGYAVDELVGRDLTEFLHEGDTNRLRQKTKRILESGPNSVLRAVYRFRRNDGKWRYVEAHAKNLLEDPAIQGIVLSGRDITYRMVTNSRLQANARQQALVARMGVVALSDIALPEFVSRILAEVTELMHAPKANVLLLNEDHSGLRLAAGVGWDGALIDSLVVSLDGRSLAGYTLEIGQPVVVEDFESESRIREPEAFRGGGVRSAVSCVIRGPERVYGTMALHHSEPRGFTTDDAYFIQSLANLVGEKAANIEKSEALRQHEERLRRSERLEALGQLAGGIAHDFNNLLTGILGYSDLLNHRIEEGSKLKRGIEEIRHAAERAADLTRQILAFGRKQLLHKRRLELNEQIEQQLNMIRRTIGERVSVRFEPLEENFWIDADPTQFDLVLLNLCINARDAIDGDGEIRIEIRRRQFTRPEAYQDSELPVGTYVQLKVSDSGCGIPEGMTQHIFEPFFTTKPEGQGTGLGLATVYGIVKQHDGFIFAYNRDSGGAAFEIFLPESTSTARTVEPTPVRDINGNGETILLAEDDEQIAAVCTEILELAGYSVIYARNGGEAVKLFKSHQPTPDLLIFDVMMPRKDGVQALREIHELAPEVPCLLCSGYPSDVVTDDLWSQPGIDFVAKPYDRRILLEKASELIDSPLS